MRALLIGASVLCLLIQVLSTSGRTPVQAPVLYRLTYPAAGSQTVHVRIELFGAATAPRTFVFPRAVPMGYGEEPYDRFVLRVESLDAAGRPLEVAREAGPRWRLGPAARVEYDVDLARMEREVLSATDSSRVRPGYVGLLGYSIFGFLEGEDEKPIELQVQAPEGWPVFSTLAPDGGPLRADNFYVLADSQLALGPDLHVEKVSYAREKEAPLFLALYAETKADRARLARLSGEATEKVLAYFGSAPFAHYTVFLEFLKPVSPEHHYGFGMEHLESFHSALEGEDGGMSDGRLRYHIAHHLAHAWIPKRCYGEGYFPFSWELAPLIDTIWFSEGFAQYAAIAALAGSYEDRREMLDRRFGSTLREAPAFLRRMPLRELSLVASTRYGSDFRTGQLTFSRGGLMAAEMDERIRRDTQGRKSLRDALRHLLAWSKENRRAFRIDELPIRFREATGVETRDILDRWLQPLE
jgi:predicted metalloprotease with PDZ domain